MGGTHLKLHFCDDDGRTGEAISFNWAQRSLAPQALHGRRVDLAVRIKKGYYLQRYYPELHVVDIRAHGGK